MLPYPALLKKNSSKMMPMELTYSFDEPTFKPVQNHYTELLNVNLLNIIIISLYLIMFITTTVLPLKFGF